MACERTAATVKGHGRKESALEFCVKQPQLWDLDTPRLYAVETSVLCQGQQQDTVRTQFGFREIRMDADTRFLAEWKKPEVERFLQPSGPCRCWSCSALCDKRVPDEAVETRNEYREMLQNAS